MSLFGWVRICTTYKRKKDKRRELEGSGRRKEEARGRSGSRGDGGRGRKKREGKGTSGEIQRGSMSYLNFGCTAGRGSRGSRDECPRMTGRLLLHRFDWCHIRCWRRKIEGKNNQLVLQKKKMNRIIVTVCTRNMSVMLYYKVI